MKLDDNNNNLFNLSTTEEEIYSSEDQKYDYLSIQGLNTRFGFNSKNFDISIIKELIDNALDFIEQNTKEFVNGKFPFVDVIINEKKVIDDGSSSNNGVVKIRVKNFCFKKA